jgi:hypothetical protein
LFLLAGLVIGLATIVRPTNIIAGALVLPWLFVKNRRTVLFSSAVSISIGFVVGIFPQVVFWRLTTGSAVSYSYGEEGFNFLAPHFWEYLFSAQKGVFFWHPFYFIMFVLSLAAVVSRRWTALPLLATVLASYYVGSSWHAWSFGGSFGARQAVDTLPLLAVGAAIFLGSSWRPSWWQGAALFLLIAANGIQMNGYIRHLIPYNDMTWDAYMQFWWGVWPWK